MIKLNRYSPEFEEEYWQVVNEKICEMTQNKIICSCEEFLPKDFFGYEEPSFKEIVLAPYHKLKQAKKYIENNTRNVMEKRCFDSSPSCKNTAKINDLYIQMYDAFEKIASKQQDKTSMRVRIVKKADITVCPYCNRDYINCRDDHTSGAQLDHFFSRSIYPIFAISLYNLVPVCANCNRIKNAKSMDFASPFDEDIDWNNDIRFVFLPKGLDDFEINIEVEPTKADAQAIKNNLTEMKIKEAYQIHGLEIKELQDKKLAYSETQEEEIRKILQKYGISDDRLKSIAFGSKITAKDMRKKPLGKMVSDWHKKWKIY